VGVAQPERPQLRGALADARRPASAPARRPVVLWRRFRRAAQRHGLAGALVRAASVVRALPSARRAARFHRRFDELHGVETASIVHLEALAIESENRSQGVRYQPTNPDVFHRLVGGLPIRCEDFAFVDFGSGKGRALILAAGYRFKRIVGVEFSRELDQIARRNVAILGEDSSRIETVCMDATRYEVPLEPLVLYFYNPFAPNVMTQVLARVRQSLDAAPRPAWIVLTGDRPLGEEIEAAGFERVDGTARTGIFATNRDVPLSGAGGYEKVAWQVPLTALNIAYWIPLIVESV
jgi:SAM-dependent methyltransferase